MLQMKKISFLFLTAAMAFSVAGGFVSCKDYEEDLRADQRVTKTVLDALKESVEGAGGVLEDITALQDSLDETKNRLEEVIANAATKDALREAIDELEDIYATQEELNVVDSTLRAEIEKAETALEGEISEQAQSLAALELRVNGAFDALGDLENKVNNVLPAQVQDAYNKAVDAFAKAEANTTAIGKLQQKDVDLKATQDSLLECYNEAIDSINRNFNELDTFVKDLTKDFTGTLAELQQTTTERLDAHKERLDSIVGAIAVINDSIESLNTKYNALKDEVLGIKDYLSHLISGVLVQSVSNPIYGSFAFPTNFSSNLLAAYYGDFSSSVEFPTAREGYYVEGSTILGVEDLNKLGVSSKTYGVGRVVNEAKNNAGTVYMTINPTNIDFTGETLELVNSLDEASGVVLDTLIKSDKKLTFGWTRGANNGFYEAGARIAAENIDNVKVRVNLSDMKDALKDVLTPGDGINVTNVVSTVANSFTDWLDANALKASWTVNGEEMAVYSEYKIAATAIKPVGYGFMQDMNVQDFPGFGTAENLLNKVFNRINVEIEGLVPTFNIDSYKFKEIKGITLSGDTIITAKTVVEIDVTIDADSVFAGYKETLEVKDAAGNVIGTVDVEVDGNNEYTKHITKEVEVDVNISDMYKDIQGDVNSFVESINNDLMEINKLLDELNKVNEISNKLTDATDKVQSALVKGLDKLNNGLCKVINSANKALQPVMLVETTDGFARLSGVQKSPSVVSGTKITLFPTSYTAEILAPAFKKLVGVTNVYTGVNQENTAYNNDECKAELQRVNAQENVAEVLDDAKAGIPVTLKQGYVYEVAYTAVDYTGMVVARKYYVTVK